MLRCICTFEIYFFLPLIVGSNIENDHNKGSTEARTVLPDGVFSNQESQFG
jgi:hypothetical protein